MRYLHVYTNNPYRPELVIDTKLKDREQIREAAYLAEKYGGNGYLTNHKRLESPFIERRQDTGEIKLSNCPKQLRDESLVTFLDSLLNRGKDIKRRQMNPRSLSNLRPRKPWDSSTRPNRPPKVTAEQIDRAVELRKEGLSWRQIGNNLHLHHETLRSAVRRSSQTAIPYSISGVNRP